MNKNSRIDLMKKAIKLGYKVILKSSLLEKQITRVNKKTCSCLDEKNNKYYINNNKIENNCIYSKDHFIFEKNNTIKNYKDMEQIIEAEKNFFKLSHFKFDQERHGNHFEIKEISLSNTCNRNLFDVFLITNNDYINVNSRIAEIANFTLSKDNYLIVYGGNMDLCHEILYNLFRSLFPNESYTNYDLSNYKIIR